MFGINSNRMSNLTTYYLKRDVYGSAEIQGAYYHMSETNYKLTDVAFDCTNAHGNRLYDKLVTSGVPRTVCCLRCR